MYKVFYAAQKRSDFLVVSVYISADCQTGAKTEQAPSKCYPSVDGKEGDSGDAKFFCQFCSFFKTIESYDFFLVNPESLCKI